MRRHWPVVEAYLVRGGICWLATRAVIGNVLLLAGLSPFRVSGVGSFEIAALSVGVSVLETFRRREMTLLANLATPPLALGILFATPAIIGELAIGLVTGGTR